MVGGGQQQLGGYKKQSEMTGNTGNVLQQNNQKYNQQVQQQNLKNGVAAGSAAQK